MSLASKQGMKLTQYCTVVRTDVGDTLTQPRRSAAYIPMTTGGSPGYETDNVLSNNRT
jgi:hypothetical protein